MAKELIAFLNFEFKHTMVNVKSVSGDTMTEVPRIAINWKEYQALLASLGVKSSVEERPLFRRYLSYLSSEDLYSDLITFQAELRQTLTKIVDSGLVPEAVWKRIFKDTNGLPMFIEPEGEGDWSFDNTANMAFNCDFSADTYRLFILATVRGLILNRRIFALTLDGVGKFGLPEETFGLFSAPLNPAAPTDAERRAALRAAVARDLPAALSRAVAENLPTALAESAAEKLPLIMEPLLEAQLPTALAEAVEEALPQALERAIAERLAAEPPEDISPIEESAPAELPAPPLPSLSIPNLRLIGPDASISVPAPAGDFVFVNAPQEAAEPEEPEEPEEIEPEPCGPVSFGIVGEDDIPDFDPVEYADSFQAGEVEEGLALLNVGGPAAEYESTATADTTDTTDTTDDAYVFHPAQPEDEDIEPTDEDIEEIEDIEPAEDVPAEEPPPPDEDEPLVLNERVETEETVAPAEEEIIDPLPLDAEEHDEDGWLPTLKMPSPKKAKKVPLEQRLATLEQRRKRRAESDAQDTFDF